MSALTVASTGSAQTAEDEFARGRALRAQHQDAEALAVFRALFERTHTPSALAQCGLAEGALGRWVDAEAHLAEALALPADEWVRTNRSANANLEAAIQQVRGRLGDLVVTSNVVGAQVWIGGRLAATLPTDRPTRVVAGSVAFEVRAPGHLTVARVANVTARGFARESMDLIRVPSTPEVVLRTTAAPPSPTAPSRVLATPVLPASPMTPAAGLRTAAWATVGGSAALLAVGGITYAVGSAAATRFNNDDLCLPAVGTRDEACHDDGRTAEAMLPISITGFLVGGVAAASAAVLFVVAGTRARAGHPRAVVACGPGPGSVGVGCAGTF